MPDIRKFKQWFEKERQAQITMADADSGKDRNRPYKDGQTAIDKMKK